MMLRDGYHVFGSSACEQSDQLVRIKVFGSPLIEQVVVRRIAVGGFMVFCGLRVGKSDRIKVPLGIRVLPGAGDQFSLWINLQ
jgi:hypothetical protein